MYFEIYLEQEKLQITKLVAAERQLREGIIMFFERRDPIATHTIVAAAHQILSDIAKHRNLVGFLKHNSLLRPEKRKEWYEIINAPFNFFKHADNDPEGSYSFNPAVTEMFILDCIFILIQINNSLSKTSNIYLTWFQVKYPELILHDSLKAPIKASIKSGLNPNDFEVVLEVIKSQEKLNHP